MDLVIVGLVVTAALAYAAWKTWNLVKPGPKTLGCSCGKPRSACSGCPLVKR